MAKKIIFLLSSILVFLVFFITNVTSATCNLKTELISQDPYPSLPGSNTEVVFQLNGIGNPDCGMVIFRLIENFPFSLEPGQNSEVNITGGTSSKDFKSFIILPFTLTVDEDSLDGNHQIEVLYGKDFLISKKFNINVDDVRTDFEVSIKDYVKSTNTLTFEILNIGENDAEALTIEIPEQENTIVKGSKRNIVGSLDSNEDTTFTFEAIPSNGQIKVIIIYTDTINERRILEKTVFYESSYFTNRVGDKTKRPVSFYLLTFIIIAIVLIWIYRLWKKRKHARHSSRQNTR